MLSLYKKATKDFDLRNVTGTLRVWRGDFRCLLDRNLVKRRRVRPVLGRKECPRVNIMKCLDNDQLNRPQAPDSEVYTHDVPATSPVSAYQLLFKRFRRVFADGVSALTDEYHMVLDESVRPVQQPPRRVPVAIRERLRETLEEKREIIARVTTPTPWISSMVVVPKKNGKLRICSDPMDLNRALHRENYPLPTIEEVASRLHGTKVSRPLMFPMASGMLFRMKSVRSVLSLIRHLEDTVKKGCRSGSDLHLKCFGVK